MKLAKPSTWQASWDRRQYDLATPKVELGMMLQLLWRLADLTVLITQSRFVFATVDPSADLGPQLCRVNVPSRQFCRSGGSRSLCLRLQELTFSPQIGSGRMLSVAWSGESAAGSVLSDDCEKEFELLRRALRRKQHFCRCNSPAIRICRHCGSLSGKEAMGWSG